MVARVLNPEAALAAFMVAVLLLPAAFAQGMTREDALQAIGQAELDLAEMAAAGFGVRSVNDTLLAANHALERADFARLLQMNVTGEVAERARSALEGLDYSGFSYADVLVYTDEVASRKQQAYTLADSLRAMELKLEEYSKLVDTTEPEAQLGEARAAFQHERYGETENLVSRANTALDLKLAERTALTVIVNSSRNLIEDNWHWLVVAGSLALLFGWIAWERIRLKRAERQLERLLAEKRALLRLVKRAQTEHFRKRTMPKSLYELRIEKYTKRLNEIEHTIPVLRSMLKGGSRRKEGAQEKVGLWILKMNTENTEKPKQQKSKPTKKADKK